MPSKNVKDISFDLKSSSIEEIKKEFDQKYSYIIFEGTEASGDKEVFEEIILLLQSSKSVIMKEFHDNKKSDRIYLLVKLEPEYSECFLEKLASTELSRKYPSYIYEAQSND